MASIGVGQINATGVIWEDFNQALQGHVGKGILELGFQRYSYIICGSYLQYPDIPNC